MTTYRIIRSLYPTTPTPRAMSTSSGQVDFLGQILLQLKKPIESNKPFKTPAETKEAIFPFTVLLRGQVHNSEISLAILRLPQNREGEAALERILAPYNITIEFIDGDK